MSVLSGITVCGICAVLHARECVDVVIIRGSLEHYYCTTLRVYMSLCRVLRVNSGFVQFCSIFCR